MTTQTKFIEEQVELKPGRLPKVDPVNKTAARNFASLHNLGGSRAHSQLTVRPIKNESYSDSFTCIYIMLLVAHRCKQFVACNGLSSWQINVKMARIDFLIKYLSSVIFNRENSTYVLYTSN